MTTRQGRARRRTVPPLASLLIVVGCAVGAARAQAPGTFTWEWKPFGLQGCAGALAGGRAVPAVRGDPGSRDLLPGSVRDLERLAGGRARRRHGHLDLDRSGARAGALRRLPRI